MMIYKLLLLELLILCLDRFWNLILVI